MDTTVPLSVFAMMGHNVYKVFFVYFTWLIIDKGSTAEGTELLFV